MPRREETTKDQGKEWVAKAMGEVGLDSKTAEAIHRLTSLCTFEERFVIPASHREVAIEMTKVVLDEKGETGFGFIDRPKRVE